MEELLNELRFELKKALEFSGLFTEIKSYSVGNKWFSAPLIDQAKSGRTIADTPKNRRNLRKLIEYTKSQVDIKLRNIKVDYETVEP